MSANSAIEWTDATWNPVTGCTKVSAGCDHCYAETLHERFHGKGSFATVTLHPDRLDLPLRWRKPRRVFVNSMSDLFHKDVPDLFIEQVFDVMEQAKHHTFQLLTKRHGRMRSFVRARKQRREDYARAFETHEIPERRTCPAATAARHRADNPPANIWLGVSVEDQERADLRIPALLDTPAAVRWISAEPLLGPVDLTRIPTGWRQQPDAVFDAIGGRYGVPSQWQAATAARLDWVVVGGESGPGARPMHPDWARALRDQCQQAGVPFLHKQNGAWTPAPWSGLDGATHAFTAGLLPDGSRHFMKLGHAPTSGERDAEAPPGAQGMRLVGKKAAGRELDGRTWDQYPAVAA